MWTGSCWQHDTSGEVMRYARDTVKRLDHQKVTPHEADAKALAQHIKSSLNATRLKAMMYTFSQ